jgi:hypothetical protein
VKPHHQGREIEAIGGDDDDLAVEGERLLA